MKIKRWHIFLGFVVSILFIFFTFCKVDFRQIRFYLIPANWQWFFLGLVFYFIANYFRALRWQVLLNPVKHLKTARLFSVVAIGYTGDNVYPARAGEILRSILLKQKDNVDISASLATIVVERLFDAIVILGFVLLNIGQLNKLSAAQGMLSSILVII